MTTNAKGNRPSPLEKTDPKALHVEQRQSETAADARAHISLRPTVQAAVTLMDFNKSFGEMSINTLVDDLVKQCELVGDGDLGRAEALLTTQAHTLDAIFHNLARRAAPNVGEHPNAAETYLRLALKAQSQCRATLETLAAMKNPQPVAFVRQANIAHGPQQVNNGSASVAGDFHARGTENRQNKLLEEPYGLPLDHGTAEAASRVDTDLETVAPINRTEVDRR